MCEKANPDGATVKLGAVVVAALTVSTRLMLFFAEALSVTCAVTV
jgi:hypothetical protein